MRSAFQFTAVKTNVSLSVFVKLLPVILMILPSPRSDEATMMVTLSVSVSESPSSGCEDKRTVNVLVTPFSSVAPEASET